MLKLMIYEESIMSDTQSRIRFGVINEPSEIFTTLIQDFLKILKREIRIF